MTPDTQRRILIIDDDLDLGEYIAATCKSLGHMCLFTASVDEFLAVHCEQASLLFIDLIMPQVDGVELLRALAARNCRTPIVLMSGVGRRVMETAEELAQALNLNIVATLQKPFQHAELKAVLQRQHVTSAAQAAPAVRKPEELSDKDLRRAIEQDQFVVYYQPQIEIATGRVAGLEALVRWQHPTAGLICPDNFISRLERLGLIDALGWLVFRRAFSELHLFTNADGSVPTLSLNCAVDSLQDLRFPDRLLELASHYRVAPSSITLEITESGLLHELAKNLDVLTRLRMKGVNLSIDDFGTGYSMMLQLRHVPATEIKIDRSFVANLDANAGDRIIIRKTIELGCDLGLIVVAEGVETQLQLDYLRGVGCHIAQGYLFSKPLPAVECLQWLAKHRRFGSLTGRTKKGAGESARAYVSSEVRMHR